MAFQFRMEKMLHFLSLKETVKKMEIVAIQRRLGFLERRKEQFEANTRNLLASHDLSYYHTTKIVLDVKEVSQLDRRIGEEKIYLEKKRGELNRLIFRKKGLEALKERKLAEHRLEEGRRAQKRMDDLHAIRKLGGK
jgi:flagellar export protein FliJ